MPKKKAFLIVDGYNIIGNWEKLKECLKISLENARNSLLDMMAEYSKMSGEKIIVIFDAYNTDQPRTTYKYKGLDVVFTEKEETADKYIERFLDSEGRRKLIEVATNDSLIQKTILSRGGLRISASELKHRYLTYKEDLYRLEKKKRNSYNKNLVSLDDGVIKKIDHLIENLGEKGKGKK
ncbi:NYN domain-containing protein [Citroniella saccharovorans]|uniref:NYN domain-containing protein n=1 Tax=Citroniella saccharovorans TaxID=2053367 RepID=A0AAW9MR88_9FIRM|nr:NYN domain-containing protein [Citroniella saccharovorans]MEB3428455.1 NYN domain-containing protein [Citroniella saccharovorans]